MFYSEMKLTEALLHYRSYLPQGLVGLCLYHSGSCEGAWSWSLLSRQHSWNWPAISILL